MSLLQNNDMLAAMPLELVQTLVADGTLAILPFDLHLSMDVYGIITRRNHQMSPVGQAMLGALRDIAATVETGMLNRHGA